MSPQRLLTLIVIITAISLYIALPSSFSPGVNFGPITANQTFHKLPIDFNLFGRRVTFDPQLKLGLDLQGGTHLVLQANMDQIQEADRADALESSKEIIARRVDLFGVAEPLIQTSINQATNEYRILVELPGIQDTNQAIDLIGQTAQLEFLAQDESLLSGDASPSAQELLSSYTPTGITGSDLKKSSVIFDQQSGKPVVQLSFTNQGRQKFSQVTEDNVGKLLPIAIDGQVISSPVVNQKIDSDQAIIQSDTFTLDEAKALSIQLNAGALPVPIEVIGQNNVGATLGQESVNKSIQAGAVGLVMVMLFMALYYGQLGVLADIALIIYGIITLALYKLIGVTLTLPGLAGFILSVGMAVDANILIFERFKEEIRSGKHWKIAMELGFGRAWDSIKDANIATLTITFILFNPLNWNLLNTSGMVRGFALTLALGIAISLFTGIIVTRTLIRLFYQGKENTPSS